jgi:hypothetical protein
MMTIRPGDFWAAGIPFTGSSASKKRPVLTSDGLLIVEEIG